MTHWWQDPAVEAALPVIYVNMIYLFLGIFGWEYFHSLGVEYAVIRRRLSFHWPLVPYLLGRVCLLIGLILLAIEMSPLSSLACQSGIISVAVFTDVAIGASSINFMIRTWVIWKNSHLVHILLIISTLGHWTILVLDAMDMNAFKTNGACIFYLAHPAVTAGVFMYTVCYDLLVLLLSIVKLSRPSKSPLTEQLLTQGLLYFAIATMANILPAVFSFLGPDTMVGITGVPAFTMSTIVSCRAVRSLLGLRTSSPSHAFNEHGENVVLTTQLENQTLALPSTSVDYFRDGQVVC